jgi:hypothetical protein
MASILEVAARNELLKNAGHHAAREFFNSIEGALLERAHAERVRLPRRWACAHRIARPRRESLREPAARVARELRDVALAAHVSDARPPIRPRGQRGERRRGGPGLSGAGKSTALHALEDLGYYCVDNLPTRCRQGDRRGLRGRRHPPHRARHRRARRLLPRRGRRARSTRSRTPGDREVIVPVPRRHGRGACSAASARRAVAPAHDAARDACAPSRPPRGPGRATIDVRARGRPARARAPRSPPGARAAIDLDTTQISVHELRRR